MGHSPDIKNAFLNQLISHIHENLADEHFGVSELAQAVSMSRSNLLRKVKHLTEGTSVSVFIRQVRLAEAKKRLQNESITISEIAFQVGFNSTSYFTRCFKEEFGYPPGEERKRNQDSLQVQTTPIAPIKSKSLLQQYLPHILFALGLVAVLLFFILPKTQVKIVETPLEKSIAVLPFINDSGDSSNIYIINGLMEAILNDLQKIEDLKVISRTSVEKFRHQAKTIPELAAELEVNYFIEGSGQKIGDQIVLSVQLIEAVNDRHIWSERYEREATGVFKLQSDIALQVANEIEAIITPEERKRIQKPPTQNSVAYDFYLEGLGTMTDQDRGNLSEAIVLFEKAIEQDEGFAQAYGYVGVCYYFLDVFRKEKKYGEKINTYADKAILLDPELGPGLIAKALFYMQDEQYALAIEFLNKVLDFYPNDAWVHNFLSDIYANYLLNTEEYLTHAIQGIQRAALDQDSATASNSYLHLSNALAQSGFIQEAETYIQRSLTLNPKNIFAETLYSYIRFAQNFDLPATQKNLLQVYQKDSNNILVMQEVAKLSYFMEDYPTAWQYYDKFLQTKDELNWDVYPGEDVKISFVLNQLGRSEEAKPYLETYLAYIKEDESIYKDLSYSAYHASLGDIAEGIEHLQAFSKEQNIQYWFVIFLENDPIMRQLSEHPAYKTTMDKISGQFWKQHAFLKKRLIENGVLTEESL